VGGVCGFVDNSMDETVELESLADVGLILGPVVMMIGAMTVFEEELLVLSPNRDLPCVWYRGISLSARDAEEVFWVL
jgi:hypothetical protein